jgi:hypothetical protein
VKPKPGEYNEPEINDCYSDALQVIEEHMGEGIRPNHYGAVNAEDPEGAPDGYYLVEWESEPYFLQEPMVVEGCDGGPMPVGTLVVPGRYLYRVSRSPHWFHSRMWRSERVVLFRVQYILDPDIALERFNLNARHTPARGNMTAEEWKMGPARCYRVPDEKADEIKLVKMRRKELDFVELELAPDEDIANQADAEADADDTDED